MRCPLTVSEISGFGFWADMVLYSFLEYLAGSGLGFCDQGSQLGRDERG